MLQEFYILLNFDLIMIYMIYKISVMFKNRLHYREDSNFKSFFKE